MMGTSSAIFNPAVMFAWAILGRTSWKNWIVLFAAQLFGGSAGVLCSWSQYLQQLARVPIPRKDKNGNFIYIQARANGVPPARCSAWGVCLVGWGGGRCARPPNTLAPTPSRRGHQSNSVCPNHRPRGHRQVDPWKFKYMFFKPGTNWLKEERPNWQKLHPIPWYLGGSQWEGSEYASYDSYTSAGGIEYAISANGGAEKAESGAWAHARRRGGSGRVFGACNKLAVPRG